MTRIVTPPDNGAARPVVAECSTPRAAIEVCRALRAAGFKASFRAEAPYLVRTSAEMAVPVRNWLKLKHGLTEEAAR